MKTSSALNLSLPDSPAQAQPPDTVTRSDSTATKQARPSVLHHVLTVAMLACFALGGWLFAGNPNSHASTSAQPMGDLSNSTTTQNKETALSTTSIEEIRLGQRVVGRNPLRHETSSPSCITPESWRLLKLSMFEYGVAYDLQFLRSTEWLRHERATVGGTIHLKLPEIGLDGPAEVIAISPCPSIESDDGTGRQVVTGLMSHPAANILDITITGLDEPLGVTTTHPIWSETRQHFVQAGALQEGEQLRSATGEVARIVRITPHRGPPQPVYNLEVNAEHVYHVAETGLLVHNSCPVSMDEALDLAAGFMEPHVPIRSINGPSGVQFIQNFSGPGGDSITRRVGFDLDPASRHVQTLGPHLNLQTQVNGVIVGVGPLADPHIPINPTTIIPGDF